MRNGGRFDVGYTRRFDARYTRRLDAGYARRPNAGYERYSNIGYERCPNTGFEAYCAFGSMSGAKTGAEMALVQDWPYSRAEEQGPIE